MQNSVLKNNKFNNNFFDDKNELLDKYLELFYNVSHNLFNISKEKLKSELEPYLKIGFYKSINELNNNYNKTISHTNNYRSEYYRIFEEAWNKFLSFRLWGHS
jgi:hypothetical protein